MSLQKIFGLNSFGAFSFDAAPIAFGMIYDVSYLFVIN